MRTAHVEETLWDLPVVRCAVVNLGVLVLVAALVRVAGVGPAEALLAAAVALGSAILPVVPAAVTGTCAWAWLTGFVVNDGGQLSASGADLTRWGLLVAVAVTVATARLLLVGHGSVVRIGPVDVRVPSRTSSAGARPS